MFICLLHLWNHMVCVKIIPLLIDIRLVHTRIWTHLDALGSRLSLISHTALQPVLSFCTQHYRECEFGLFENITFFRRNEG